MIRLFIIEDHPVIIFGLQNIFRSTGDGIEVVDSAASVTEAESKANVGGFDLIILDLWIAKDDPEVNITRLKTKFPGKPIVIYTCLLYTSPSPRD